MDFNDMEKQIDLFLDRCWPVVSIGVCLAAALYFGACALIWITKGGYV